MDEVIRKHIEQTMDKGVRFDGRSLDQFREIEIQTGISATAEGSAMVNIGKTCVVAGVKLSLETPYPDTPDKGNLMVNAELLPLSSPLFESGPPSMASIELARITDRGIRESEMIDSHKLCVKEGEKVWSVSIDICTINHDGNLYDAATLAAVAAVQNAVFPTVNADGTVDYKKKTNKKLPLEQIPVSITVHKIGSHYYVDPLLAEDGNSDGRLTVCSLEDGTICALQKGGELSFSLDDVNAMIDIALKHAKVIRKKLK